ncbi:MAG: glycosyltransferase family 39 protein [Ardenticatenales bacterium]|nr:glycosyltransferase family 39 protein [Ardenticatenales bacterium]
MIEAPDPMTPAPAPAVTPRPGMLAALAQRIRRLDDATTAVALVVIVLSGFYLRTVGIDWDAGQHLHPDERFLTDVASSLAMPNDLLHYLDTDTSTLNPRNMGKAFFSYGTWPITIARVMADANGPLGLGMTDFSRVYIVGRYMSALLDLLTVLLVFGLGAVLYDRRVGLLASLFTSFTAFHIQQAHFFTVDAALTTFVTLTLFGLALAIRRESWWPIVLAGVGLGMALGSKITVFLLIPVAILAIAAGELRHARLLGLDRDASWRRLYVAAGKVAVLGLVSYVALRFAQPDMWAGPGWPNVVGNSARLTEVTTEVMGLAPDTWTALRKVVPDGLEKYVLPDPRWLGNMERIKSQVTGFGMDWPPNHQWWGRMAYVFPWRNMVLWGMGPALGLAAWLGWLAAGVAIWRGRRRHLLLWLWVAVYFGYTGIQWGKTMRYGLPIYPALAVLAGWGLVAWLDRARAMAAAGERDADVRADAHAGAPDAAGTADTAGDAVAAVRRWRIPGPLAARAAGAALAIVVVGTVAWGFMFSRLYTRHHSRVAGSHWVYHNLPTAVGVRISADAKGLFAGPWLPAQAPGALRTVGGIEWPLDAAWAGPMRLLLPDESWQQRHTGDQYGAKPDLWTPKRGSLDDAESLPAVTVDAVRLAYARGSAGGDRTVRVVLSSGASLGAGGVPERPVAQGRVAAGIGAEPADVVVPLDAPIDLRLGQEIYVWVAVDGGPVTVRPARLAYETGWDDIVPDGMYGYGGYDDAKTDWADGLFGVTQLEMYGEDYPDWLNQTIEQIGQLDYWVSSSNRVYGAVAQLPMRYPATIAFYQDVLFGETQGWRHIAAIRSFPNLGPLAVDDQGAEEAYHVYDHPAVDVFKRPEPFDGAALRAYLAPLNAARHWSFPPVSPNPITRFLDAILGRIPVDRAAPIAEAPGGQAAAGLKDKTIDAILLSDTRAARQRAGGTWRAMFNVDSPINRFPALAVLLWYAVLSLLGLAAFPLVAVALPRLPDRGWSVARTAGLLLTSYVSWLAASTDFIPNTWLLLVASALAVAVLSALVARWAGFRPLEWFKDNREAVLGVEFVFLAVFVVFLGIRYGNPDLWHTSKGGEKPMDFAYLNAVLRSVHYPPYDPWFSGSKLNYYYYGFVFIGTLIKLTRIVPWLAYNLAIPTLAAMTAAGVYGIVVGWAGRLGVRTGRARRSGVVAAVMAVLMGNLYQAPWMAARLAEIGPQSGGDAVERLSSVFDKLGSFGGWARAFVGLWDVVSQPLQNLPIPLDWWYWNASRAIPSVSGDVQPITEFPFFTFLYADLHAHMMAMPIAVLACAVALGWALPGRPPSFRLPWLAPEPAVRMALGALAIGALWPTNTWDFPTYGLIAAGAIALGAYARTRRVDAAWLGLVAATGGLLLGLSLLFFLPYHLNYITPYSEFKPWIGFRTPTSAYLTIHGIFLFALVSFGAADVMASLRRRDEGRAVLGRTVVLAAAAAAGAVLLWRWSLRTFQADLPAEVPRPELLMPLLILGLVVLGLSMALRRTARQGARLLGWYVTVGALLTGFVEYVVLSGDIGRMNTVFKFYIHVWVLWSIGAGVALAAFLEWLVRRPNIEWRWLWRGTMAALVCCGLVYTVTAARAKIEDRFPADRSIPEADMAALHRPGLSGIDYMAHAAYIEYDEHSPQTPHLLELSADHEAIQWLLANVDGTPTILEGTWPINYHWGSRISIYTGLPTVIGWDWHQRQQKAAITNDPVGNRLRDVETIYGSTDAAEARRLLCELKVELIIVGQLETMRYDAAGLDKFARWAQAGEIEAVFQNEHVTIYRRPLDPAGAPCGAAEPASAVAP